MLSYSRNWEVGSVGVVRWPLRVQCRRKKVHVRYLISWWVLVFSDGTVRSAAAWPPVNCVCVSQLFQQLISTMLCPAFLRKLVGQPLCCTNFSYLSL